MNAERDIEIGRLQERTENHGERYAHPDSLGYLAIGIGHLVDRCKGGVLPGPVIDALLDWDIAAKTIELIAVRAWVADLEVA